MSERASGTEAVEGVARGSMKEPDVFPRNDRRRRSILTAAGEVFGKSGFNGSSMSAISAALGGSKGTLYNYFRSKEELYEAVILAAVEDQVEKFSSILEHRSEGLAQTLHVFGRAYLAWILSPGAAFIQRGGMEARDVEGLGSRLYERGPKRCWSRVADFLQLRMQAGELRSADPMVAALHLKGLLQAGSFEPHLFGAPSLLPHDKAVEEGIEAFLRAYQPETPSVEPIRQAIACGA